MPNANPALCIDSFSGQYRFLSNFWLVEVEHEGWVYPSVEHAFQAAKCMATDRNAKQRIAAAPTPGQAKYLGRRVVLRPDWDEIKLQVMYELIRAKFKTDPLRARLLATGTAELIEGNTWGDTFWGVCNGSGTNHLGKTLMTVRTELHAGA